MQEADALSSRIGILINGALRCLGTPTRLKTIYGSTHLVNLRLNTPSKAENVKDWIGSVIPGSRVVSCVGCAVVVEVPKAGAINSKGENDKALWEGLSLLEGVFEGMEKSKRDVEKGVLDFSVSVPSLEQVFMEFAQLQKAVGVV
jgi:ABC-type multidrug transport system ATPase subunit